MQRSKNSGRQAIKVIKIDKANSRVVIEKNDKRFNDTKALTIQRSKTPTTTHPFERPLETNQPVPISNPITAPGSLPNQISQNFNSIPIDNPSNSTQLSIQHTPQTQTTKESNQQQKNLNFERLSLLSFVSSFEDEKSFNETDLEVLGLDLKCQEPLLPMLHSVLSDAPLLDHSRHPMPECYSKIQAGNPADKLSFFTPNTLLFIFYTYPRDPLQIQAAEELKKRQWVFDEENEEWRDQDGNIWSVDQWRELDENQQNELDDS